MEKRGFSGVREWAGYGVGSRGPDDLRTEKGTVAGFEKVRGESARTCGPKKER